MASLTTSTRPGLRRVAAVVDVVAQFKQQTAAVVGRLTCVSVLLRFGLWVKRQQQQEQQQQ